MAYDLGKIVELIEEELKENSNRVVEIKNLNKNELDKLQDDYLKDYDTTRVLSLSPDLPSPYLQNYVLHVRSKNA